MEPSPLCEIERYLRDRHPELFTCNAAPIETRGALQALAVAGNETWRAELTKKIRDVQRRWPALACVQIREMIGPFPGDPLFTPLYFVKLAKVDVPAKATRSVGSLSTTHLEHTMAATLVSDVMNYITEKWPQFVEPYSRPEEDSKTIGFGLSFQDSSYDWKNDIDEYFAMMGREYAAIALKDITYQNAEDVGDALSFIFRAPK